VCVCACVPHGADCKEAIAVGVPRLSSCGPSGGWFMWCLNRYMYCQCRYTFCSGIPWLCSSSSYRSKHSPTSLTPHSPTSLTALTAPHSPPQPLTAPTASQLPQPLTAPHSLTASTSSLKGARKTQHTDNCHGMHGLLTPKFEGLNEA
jgi:hypothetical protein